MMTPLPEWINPESWAGFCAMRVKIRKPLTDRAKTMLLKRLYEMRNKGHDVNACLDQSEFHCWLDVFEVKEKPIAKLGADTEVLEQIKRDRIASQTPEAIRAREKAASWLKVVGK
jgi:hypothetical protein